ncbi:hypothetical protein MANES_02G068550v8 [Manihot esculenta]|uniref:Uncharacterized protein n=1 Tax=Manihot esculenta TaxID=3983 RepID=A0ACB7I5F9_MANES|nr:hypothetical protein MANES_02G068550v8 [Manihot esculenta]
MQTTTAIFAPENEETVSKQGNEAGPYPCPRPHQSRKHNRPLGSSYFSSQSLVRTYQSGIQFIAVRAFYFCELQWLRIFRWSPGDASASVCVLKPGLLVVYLWRSTSIKGSLPIWLTRATIIEAEF